MFLKYVNLQEHLTKSHIEDGKTLSALYATILSMSEKNVFTSDVSSVDYNEYRGSRTTDPQLLRDIYCDDGMFIQLVPASTFTKFNETSECSHTMIRLHRMIREYLSHNGNFDPLFTDVMRYPGKVKAIRSAIFKEMKGSVDMNSMGMWLGTTRKGGEVLVESIDTGYTGYIERVTSSHFSYFVKDKVKLDRYKRTHPRWEIDGIGYIVFKISFSQWTFNQSLKFIESCRSQMEGIDMYLQQFDMTSDIGCSFDKTEMVSYLERIGHKSTTGGSFMNSVYGSNCLSYRSSQLIPTSPTPNKNSGGLGVSIQEINQLTASPPVHLPTQQNTQPLEKNKYPVKYKIYNKFAQSLESKSVTSPIGDNLYNWINNFEDPIRDSINKSVLCGFTRIEVSFFFDDCDGDVSRYITLFNDYLRLIKDSGLLFIMPISKQWESFTKALTQNAFIYNMETHEYVLAMWTHNKMKRVGGSYGTLTKSQDRRFDRFCEYVRSHFSYPGRPFYVITLSGTDDPLCMRMDYETYIKSGEWNGTLLWKGSFNGLMYDASEDEGRYATRPRNQSPNSVGIVSVNDITIELYTQRLRWDLINLCTSREIESLPLPIVADPITMPPVHKRIFKRLTETIYYGNVHYLVSTTEGEEIVVVAFKRFVHRNSVKYAMVTDKNICYHSNLFVEFYINSILGKLILTHDIYHHASLNPIFSFKTGKLVRDENSTRCRSVLDFILLEDEVDDSVMKVMSGEIRHIDGIAINRLNPGDKIKVVGYSLIIYRQKPVYMLYGFHNEDPIKRLYSSNLVFTELLEKHADLLASPFTLYLTKRIRIGTNYMVGLSLTEHSVNESEEIVDKLATALQEFLSIEMGSSSKKGALGPSKTCPKVDLNKVIHKNTLSIDELGIGDELIVNHIRKYSFRNVDKWMMTDKGDKVYHSNRNFEDMCDSIPDPPFKLKVVSTVVIRSKVYVVVEFLPLE